MKKTLIGLIITHATLLAEPKCLPDFFSFVKLKEKKYEIKFSKIEKTYQREMGGLIIREKNSDNKKILIVDKKNQLKYLKCIIPFATEISWTSSAIKLEN